MSVEAPQNLTFHQGSSGGEYWDSGNQGHGCRKPTGAFRDYRVANDELRKMQLTVERGPALAGPGGGDLSKGHCGDGVLFLAELSEGAALERRDPGRHVDPAGMPDVLCPVGQGAQAADDSARDRSCGYRVRARAVAACFLNVRNHAFHYCCDRLLHRAVDCCVKKPRTRTGARKWDRRPKYGLCRIYASVACCILLGISPRSWVVRLTTTRSICSSQTASRPLRGCDVDV